MGRMIKIAFIYLLIVATMPYNSFAGGDGSLAPKVTCENVLKACEDVVAEQDVSIVNLKQHVKDLEEISSKGVNQGPNYLIIIVTAVLGLFVGSKLSN